MLEVEGAAAAALNFDFADDGNRTTSCCGTIVEFFPAVTTSPSGVSPFCWVNEEDENFRSAYVSLFKLRDAPEV